jgi:ParB/RepB/Spo0J family partition protein
VVRCTLADPAAARNEDMFEPGFEIVFGHRRKRAAELAGLTTVPCIVRSMTDAQVRSAQMSENIQRENMQALEEGAGFKVQMLADSLTAGAIAHAIGKSESYVLGRVKLLTLVPAVKSMLLAGDIGAEAALLIARLGHPTVQEKALAEIQRTFYGLKELEDGGKRSFRSIRDMLAEKFTLQLKDALFDPEDGTLVHEAGDCTACPKLSGNAPEYADLLDENTAPYRRSGPRLCTDPECFALKKKAHLDRIAQRLESEGKTVVTGSKAKAALDAHGNVKGAYIALKDVQGQIKSIGKNGAAVPVVQIQDPRTGKTVKAVAKAELRKAGVDLEATDHKAADGHGQRDWEAERRERQAQADLETAARRNLLANVHAVVAQRPRSIAELRVVVHALLNHHLDWEDQELIAKLLAIHSEGLRETTDNLAAAVDRMSPDELALLLLDIVLVHKVEIGGHDLDDRAEVLEAMASLHGIDIEAARAGPLPATEPASTPSPAAQAQTSAKGKAKNTARPPRGVKYQDPATGATWSGRGLMPKWLKVAIERGDTLAQYQIQTDEAGPAGHRGARTAQAAAGAAA